MDIAAHTNHFFVSAGVSRRNSTTTGLRYSPTIPLPILLQINFRARARAHTHTHTHTQIRLGALWYTYIYQIGCSMKMKREWGPVKPRPMLTYADLF
jgi:hypothetical protein